MAGSISHNRFIESLKEAASWPGADRNTLVVLGLSLASAHADEEGSSYFHELSERDTADATVDALAGYFQVRAGHDPRAAMAKLDAAATMEPGLPQYFRGLALAELLSTKSPSHTAAGAPDAARAEQIVADLEFVLRARDQFPVALIRGAHQGLARAYAVLGSDEQAAEALHKSGLPAAALDRSPAFTSFSLTARDGMRLSTPGTLSPAPDVHVVQSYDFGDFGLVKTSAGLVAIDAGTSPDRVQAAITDLGLDDDIPASHIIFTHSHFDHIGGAGAMIGPSTRTIAASGFPAEAERQSHWSPPFRYLIGTDATPSFDVTPTELISEQTSLVVGDTEFVLIPVRGGETRDALMVYLPDNQLLFVGDVMMPYLGIPFGSEGSPEGLMETMKTIRALAPRQLIAGHTTLTENFTIEVLAGVEPALSELHQFVMARIDENLSLPEILDLAYLPAVLRDHPAAVTPYLVSRETFVARTYHQHSGYWQAYGEGLEPRSKNEKAAALDLLVGGQAEAFVQAGITLVAQGDLALALEIVEAGLIRHPDNSELEKLRNVALAQLMEQRQFLDPFGFLVYAELAGAQLTPVG